MVNFEVIRKQSLITASQLGYPINDRLPLLDEGAVTRSRDEVFDRLLGMLCVAACAYGFDNQRAIEWLRREAGTEMISPTESRFLQTKIGKPRSFMEQIEGMWTLAWSINIVPRLDFGFPCEQNFVLQLPDLKGNESSADLRNNAKRRQDEEIVAACDLAYCLHWAIRDARLHGTTTPGKVDAYVVVERKRALEWLLTDASWEDVSFDT
jgi:hypothetical protein